MENKVNSDTKITKDVEGDFYLEAVAEVRKEKTVSISRLQRTLRIGYNRACRLLEAMQDEGIISNFNGKGVRKVIDTA